jgi:ABC transporter substrate binding protein (PQQ-dependent alcohol dehydrogenase system)
MIGLSASGATISSLPRISSLNFANFSSLFCRRDQYAGFTQWESRLAKPRRRAKLRRVDDGVVMPGFSVSRFAGRACIAALTALPFGISPAPARDEAAALRIGYVGPQGETPAPFGIPGKTIKEEGLAGALLGIADNETTGKFIGQNFELVPQLLNSDGEPAAAIRALAERGVKVIVANLDAPELLQAAEAAGERSVTLLNVRAPDDALRNEQCRAEMLHTIPSRAMLTDALAQYLAWKKWQRWFVVVGPTPSDRRYADNLRASAKKFGAQIVVEKDWTFQTTNARADTGHVTLQTEIPSFTRAADHDVLIVADEARAFGDYLLGRTALPRPVFGTAGMVATGWSPINTEWGALQLQNRFSKRFGRDMTAIDYAAWIAARSIGEAATRTRSMEPEAILQYLRGAEFVVSGFKGRGQSFRPWDGQMRQPILIAAPNLLVSASPQPGYLHRVSELDTLGTDREESKCRK